MWEEAAQRRPDGRNQGYQRGYGDDSRNRQGGGRSSPNYGQSSSSGGNDRGYYSSSRGGGGADSRGYYGSSSQSRDQGDARPRVPYVDSYRAQPSGRNLDPGAVAERIQRFDAQVRELRSLNQKIGTRHDTTSFRQQLSKCREQAKENATTIGHYFTDNQGVMRDPNLKKLHRDFTRVFENFRSVNQESLNLEQENITRMSVYRKTSSSALLNEPPQQRQDQLYANANKVTHADFDFLAEREQEYENLARDAVKLKELFQEVNELAETQAVQVEQVATNIEDANQNVRAGVEQLAEAATKQKKSNKRMWYIFIAILILLIIILVPLILKFTK